MAVTTCQRCSQHVILSPVAATGTIFALEPETVSAPAPELIALNPKTRLCRILNRADLFMAADWADHGVTFHHEHTCGPLAA